MNFLAKNQDNFYKVLELEEDLTDLIKERKCFFEFDNDINEIDFIKNPTYKLEKKSTKDDSVKDDWFFIDYSKNQNIKEIIGEYRDIFESSAEYCSNLTIENINKISFLINAKKVEGQYSINFQVVTSGSYIKSRQFLKIGSKKARYKKEENILNINDKIDIHISEINNKIYFKNFAHIKKINEVFIELYRESTEEEIKSFFEKISECSMFSIQDFPKQEKNSKGIKYILDNKGIDFSKNKGKISDYIEKYPTNLNKDSEGLYKIHSNKDLTNFLKIINEHYYEGEITGNHMESNSSKTL
ncbi:hypothetical protein [Bathymodiolus thermophilus thioautotrophic gill symbiont]|uniref:DUF4868 domain-containing protein n=1 Tax=Bathymodiolus thermophilus thioautotrophic gill symbiont TaxID=2360 RepID=A0A1J5UB48_9GAMM|nr:hypothetical protein [Bathymodiolus thermophilus thioautotrophic gill symbiont]OIR25601.1 hypothetical protein BGC33_07200 [Bathymodiolus thermophilus thioautotrophic gill symbiont]